MFNRRQNNNQAAAAEYTSVPTGAGAGTGVGGTANYPAVDQKVGYGNQAGKDVNMRSGYGPGYDTTGNNVQNGGYGGPSGPGYVQQQTTTPVSYGPNGQPVDAYGHRKPSNRVANRCAALFVACWACTWPCHGPCCCGL